MLTTNHKSYYLQAWRGNENEIWTFEFCKKENYDLFLKINGNFSEKFSVYSCSRNEAIKTINKKDTLMKKYYNSAMIDGDKIIEELKDKLVISNE